MNTLNCLQFRCCGVKNYMDWYNATNVTSGNLPLSCCRIPPGTTQQFVCNKNTLTLYTEGCLSAFGDYIRGHSTTVETVGITLAVVQVH